MKKARIDITGQTFGLLTVLEFVGTVKRRGMYRCRCACGVRCNVEGYAMRIGRTKSCGCLRKKVADDPSAQSFNEAITE